MKFFHNDRVSLAWALAVEIVVHLLFASQAFLLGSFLGEIALTVIFGRWGIQIGAWVLALFIFGASFQAFVLGEYMREHVESFETTEKGNGSYIKSWDRLRWLVAAIEISSLDYRLIVVWQDGSKVSSVIIGIMGLVLLWYAFVQAKIIHASVNRPIEYDVLRAREQAGRRIVDDGLKYIPDMSTEQARRFYNGDATAVDEVHAYYADLQATKLQSKEERERQSAEKKRRKQQGMSVAQKFTRTLLGGDNPLA